MVRKIKYLLIGYCLILFLGILSCADCPGSGYRDRFKIISLDWRIYSISYTYSTFSEYPVIDKIDLSPLVQNSVLYSQYGISITPRTRSYRSSRSYYSYSRNKINTSNFINSAYACSLAEPTTDDRIRDIKIFSKRDFNSQYPAGSNLVPLFDIIVRKQKYEDTRRLKWDLTKYLLTSSIPVPARMILVLKESPEVTADYTFNIEYYQDGKDLDFFEFATRTVEIRTK